MKYGESFFDIAYLVIAIGIGIFLLAKASGKLQKLMGAAALVLGCGDAFHLVPRVLNYFVEKDFSTALGIGKLVTSITMTVFYILMYYIYLHNFQAQQNKGVSAAVWGLAVIRIALCLFPQNEWLSNNSPLLWGILRNIPFAVLGLIIVILYFRHRKGDACFRFVWLYVALSFLFYIPVVVGADAVPLLGALMLPKTICYVLILLTFLKKKKEVSS
ncbi:MAG: hypothetical protein IJJ41_05275 [Clostridia bacterium]|nr:hypothetical protein [Clostridia bacterium]